MAGRPKIFEKQEIINKAIEVFWKKGYEASSATELLNAMNIGKGSFYLAFKGGKKELYETSLEQFSAQALQVFKQKLSESDNSITFLKNFFLSLADRPEEIKLKGCYFGNAILEMSNLDNELKNKAANLLAQLEYNFEKIIETAQQNNELTTKQSPKLLARHLINLWNGINLTQRMHADDQYTKETIEINLNILH